MLKVECESCKAPYQVDERRVPPTGLKMRCPKCGHTFMVNDPSKAAAAPAAPTPAAPAGKMKSTMMGVGLPNRPPGAAPRPAPAPPAALGNLDDGLDLPAKPAPRPAAAAPKPPPAVTLPGLDDLDLPALAGDIGLPATAHRPPARRAPPGPPAPKAPATLGFDVDLPAVPPAGPPGGAGFGGFDLPSPKPVGGGFGDVDLPSPRGDGGFGNLDLPSPKPVGGGFGDVDLPSPRGDAGFGSLDLPLPKGGGGFADLPMLQNDLPLVGGNLPSPVSAGLPVPVPGEGLPMPVPGAGLPSPVAGGGLPLPKHTGGGFGELDLPMTQNDLPRPLGLQAQMPAPVADGRPLPSVPGSAPPLGAALGEGAAFGELELPLTSSPGGPSPAALRDSAVSFGELDLPADPSVEAPAPMTSTSDHPPGYGGGGSGGMGFGELDLGGSDSIAPGPAMGPPPATSAGNFAFQEAAIPTTEGKATGARAEPVVQKPSSKAPKIVAAAAALLVVGGAALQFTPVGAFGYVAISDKLHQGDYAKDAVAAGDAARQKLAVDTYASALAAADELGELRKRSPRSRSLAAYAAFVELQNQVRFGLDAARVARAKTYLSEIPPGTEVPYLLAAIAAQDAANGDWAKARKNLDFALAREPNDGIRTDLAVLKGELDLADKNYPNAVASFTEAQKSGPSARATHGIARAWYHGKNPTKAKEAVDATLKLSPAHAGALSLRALLTWDLTRDDAAALKDLATVLDESSKKSLGTSEVSTALAAKGWIMLARDRAGEARAAFDEAVKIDVRNVSALVGQGEVLYADGRYTEALTRFEEAVQKDPTGLPATIGAAKAKIALERLADAKAQLGAARQRAPKDMGVALWLAKCEEALGNKPAADQLYTAAIDLADAANPDAIQAYAAYARFLAGQGKIADAAAKLDAAKAKLPDSAALQRAFGEVAAAQGQFDEAVAHFEAALQKNPADLGTRFRLGVTYRRMRKLELATTEFDTVAAGDKDYPGLALERGMLFEESGDVNRALEQFQSAFQKAPNDVDLMLRIGAAYVAIGKTEEALPILSKVKDQRPNSAEANHFLGRAHLRQGGLEAAAAMRYLKRAVELDPNRAEYHLYVAWAANDAVPAQLDIARTHVDIALKLDRLLADAYWQRGVVERRSSAVNDAIKDLTRALELKPGRIEAHAALAECYEDKNDVPRALKEWATAIAADDKQPYWRWKYGRLLTDRNQPAEAARHLVYAVEQGKGAQPRPGWLWSAAFEAGEALRRSGQAKAAIEHYGLYLELAPTTDPNRRDALRGLSDLGAPYEGR